MSLLSWVLLFPSRTIHKEIDYAVMSILCLGIAFWIYSSLPYTDMKALFSLFMSIFYCWLGQHNKIPHGANIVQQDKAMHIDRDKSSKVKIAPWNHTRRLSFWVYFGFILGSNLTLVTCKAKPCALAGYEDWGLLTCSWCRHVSFSIPLILFDLPWKEWWGRRDRMRDGKIQRIFKSITFLVYC